MHRWHIVVPDDLAAAVDRHLDGRPLSAFVRKAVEQALGEVAPNESPSSNAAVQNANRPAPAEQPEPITAGEIGAELNRLRAERGEGPVRVWAERRHSATCRCGVCVPEKKK